MYGNLAQRFAPARARHAQAVAEVEAGAMHRADQQAILAAQELAGRPVQPPARMRTYVQPGAYARIRTSMNEQRLRIAIDHRLGLVQGIEWQGVEPNQRLRGEMRVMQI